MILFLVVFSGVFAEYQIIEQSSSTTSHGVTRNKWNEIDSFKNNGIIISAKWNDEQVCKIQQQEMKLIKLRDINIIPKFQEKLFRTYFHSGKFLGHLPEFIAITAVSDGLIILTNDHTLLYVLRHRSQFAVQSSIVLDVGQEILRPVHMIEYQDKLIIFLQNISVFIDLDLKNENVNIFGKKTIKSEQVSVKDIIKIIPDKFIYLATSNSLSSYELKNNKLVIVESVRISGLDDFTIDSNTIYVLQQRNIQQYSLELVQKNTSNQVIGDIIAVQNQTLIVAQFQDHHTLITDMQLRDDSLFVNRVFKIPGQVSQIKIIDYFAILKTEQEHKIYYHSIPSYFKDAPLVHEMKLVNSKYTYIQKLEQDYIIYGVTSHSFVSYYAQHQSPSLLCYMNDVDQTITVDLYTTQCDANVTDSQSVCHQRLTYQMYILEAYLTTQHKLYLVIFLITIVLIVGVTLIILYVRYIQVKNYRALNPDTSVDNNVTDNQGISIKSRNISIMSTPNNQAKALPIK